VTAERDILRVMARNMTGGKWDAATGETRSEQLQPGV
jgi:hypothetical protein